MDKAASDRQGAMTPAAARAARLKAALRANLQRRKAQGRARSGSGEDTDAVDPPPEGPDAMPGASGAAPDATAAKGAAPAGTGQGGAATIQRIGGGETPATSGGTRRDRT